MSDRKLEVKTQINNFIKATKTKRRELCSFGVEFEYQYESNYGCDCDIEQVYDMEEVTDAEYAYAENEYDSEFFNYLSLYHFSRLFIDTLPQSLKRRGRYNTDRKAIAFLVGKLRKKLNEGDTPEEFFNKNSIYFSVDYAELRDDVIQRLRESAEVDWEDYRYSTHSCDDTEVYTTYDWTPDQSVSGGEIRTEGALDYMELVGAIGDIISDIDRADGAFVDTDCSAHLHVQLGDLHHYYGKGKLHNLIMEYFSFNKHRLPKCVQERLAGGGNRWIEPSMHHSKYTWVYFHPQGTIEFRLFGAIADVGDMKVCIDEALAALAYGYKQRLNKKEVISNTDFIRRLAA